MNNGKQGEQLFKQIMEGRNYTVEDVSNNSAYWNKDIDFIVTSPTTGATKSFEVKWDSKIHKTGNLYLEIASSHSIGGMGFFEFCEADYLAYGDAVNNKFYVFSLLELKEKVKHMPKHYGQCGNESIGLLVSLSSVKELYQELKV